MAAKGLKVISYAFKDMPLRNLNELMHIHSLESKEFRDEVEKDLIYLCTFGLDDPCRVEIHKTVELIKYGNNHCTEAVSSVNVKMLTGDHIETARFVALKCGIIT
jgi:magnesium-transporting ATPase (P-type)